MQPSSKIAILLFAFGRECVKKTCCNKTCCKCRISHRVYEDRVLASGTLQAFSRCISSSSKLFISTPLPFLPLCVRNTTLVTARLVRLGQMGIADGRCNNNTWIMCLDAYQVPIVLSWSVVEIDLYVMELDCLGMT